MKRRYKVLCDNIFLSATDEALRKSNMNKLLFYSMSRPEKLDRIGKYLLSLQRKHVSRNKKIFIIAGIEAFDQLMASRVGHTVLITESYLRMLHTVLETKELSFFEYVVESFWKFAQIKDDASPYRGNLNFFVDRFCDFSFIKFTSEDEFTRFRLSSIKGIKGLICKAVNDNLQLTIYSPEYISQIIPVIFFNLFSQLWTEGFFKTIPISDQSHKIVNAEAKDCLRDLLSRATYNSSVSTIVLEVLKVYDSRSLWTMDKPLPMKYFKLIICSFPLAHTDVVVTLILNHLAKHDSSSTDVRIGICKVIKGIIEVLSKNYMSDSILDLISRLLQHTINSLKLPQNDTEKEYQSILSQIIVNFTRNLSSFQRAEVMSYILNKITFEDSMSRHLILLETVEEISRDSEMDLSVRSQFPSSSFLDNLMGLLLDEISCIRLKAQIILQLLFDRKKISPQIPDFRNCMEFDYSSLSFSKVKNLDVDNQDIVFMVKNGITFFVNLQSSTLIPNNTLDNFEQLFRTIFLINLYFPNCLIDIIRLLMHVQNFERDELHLVAFCQVQALVASLFTVVSQSQEYPHLAEYVHEIVVLRSEKAPYFLPEWFYLNETSPDVCADYSNYLFDSGKIGLALDGNDRRDELLQPFTADINSEKLSDLDVLDTQSGSLDIALINIQKNDSFEEIKFDTLKKIKENSLETQEMRKRMINDKPLVLPSMDINKTYEITIPADMSDIFIEMR